MTVTPGSEFEPMPWRSEDNHATFRQLCMKRTITIVVINKK